MDSIAKNVEVIAQSNFLDDESTCNYAIAANINYQDLFPDQTYLKDRDKYNQLMLSTYT